jgi:hypothetical protein
LPIYESICDTCRKAIEWIGKYEQAEPFCECGKQMRRAPSRFGIVWTGPLTTKYNNKKLEYAHVEEHTAYRIKSSRSGKPEPVRITNWQERREFMKAEGLVGVEDLGDKFEASSTGKMPGTDIKVDHDPTVTITRGPSE